MMSCLCFNFSDCLSVQGEGGVGCWWGEGGGGNSGVFWVVVVCWICACVCACVCVCVKSETRLTVNILKQDPNTHMVNKNANFSLVCHFVALKKGPYPENSHAHLKYWKHSLSDFVCLFCFLLEERQITLFLFLSVVCFLKITIVCHDSVINTQMIYLYYLLISTYTLKLFEDHYSAFFSFLFFPL